MFRHAIFSQEIHNQCKKSCAPLDIHKSKLEIVKIHFAIINKNMFVLFSQPNLVSFLE
jgi:hypothetical protein